MAGVKRKRNEIHHSTNRRPKPAAMVTSTRVTRAMQRSAAGHAVFATTELLESILLELPFFSLVTVQRVSRAFNECVSRSHKLQSKLLLRPGEQPPEGLVVEGRRREDGSVQWRFAQEHHIDEKWCNTLPEDPARVYTPHLLCPILNQNGTSFNVRGIPFACDAYIDAPFLRSRPDFNLASPGSWCNMAVTDPPCTKAYIKVKYTCWSNAQRVAREVRFTADRMISNAEGITCGELFDGASIQPGSLDGYTTRDHASAEASGWLLYDYEDFDMPEADMAGVRDNWDETPIEDELRQLWKRFPGIWTIDAKQVSCTIYHVVPSDVQWQAVRERAAEQRAVQGRV